MLAGEVEIATQEYAKALFGCGLLQCIEEVGGECAKPLDDCRSDQGVLVIEVPIDGRRRKAEGACHLAHGQARQTLLGQNVTSRGHELGFRVVTARVGPNHAPMLTLLTRRASIRDRLSESD